MDIFVYIGVGSTSSRDEIEEAIDEILDGRGEVTGGGSGVNGSNIDIEIFDDNDTKGIQEVKAVLRSFNLPSDTTIVINGERSNLY